VLRAVVIEAADRSVRERLLRQLEVLEVGHR
jgi:hypothetical protein